MIYIASKHRHVQKGSLLDCDAAGSIAGDDQRIKDKTIRQIDIEGIDNHQIKAIPFVMLCPQKAYCYYNHASKCVN